MTVPTLPAGLPPDLNMVLLRGRFRKLDGTPVTAPVTLEASTRLRSPKYHTTILNIPVLQLKPDVAGEIAVLVPSTDDPDILPANWYYILTEPDGLVRKFRVPYNQTEIWLDNPLYDVDPATPTEPLPPGVVTVDYLGVPGGVPILDAGGDVPATMLGNVHRNVYTSASQPTDAQEGDLWVRNREDAEGTPGFQAVDSPTNQEFGALTNRVEVLEDARTDLASYYTKLEMNDLLNRKAGVDDLAALRQLIQRAQAVADAAYAGMGTGTGVGGGTSGGSVPTDDGTANTYAGGGNTYVLPYNHY